MTEQPGGDGQVEVWDVDTPGGPGRAHHHPARDGRPRATLVLGHGIGGGVDAPDLAAIAGALPELGVEVVLFEQPWRVQGRRIGGPAATLDASWVSFVADLRGRGVGTRRLVAGGRSTGGRVACRTVGAVQPAALLLLAFPMWPARRPPMADVASRLPELAAAAAAVPTVVVQGTRDRLGSADDIAMGLTEANVTARVVPVPDADHAFAVPRSSPVDRQAALDLVVRAARATALRIIDGHY